MSITTHLPVNPTQAAPLTVVLCTYNPRRDILDIVLDALEQQTLPKSQWELLVVDNNSTPPLDADDLKGNRSFRTRVVRETWQGKVPAYRAGVLACESALMVMLDDDNALDPDYLEQAMKLAAEFPDVGAFGGIARLKLEGPPVSDWRTKLLPFLGIRDYGNEPITSSEDKWGEWEPIGAGMVLRKTVGDKFVQMVDTIPEAARLDRSGSKGLLSGGDSLLARASYRVGMSCSYQPALKFDHHIKAFRLKTRYLARIMLGHGRSVVMLNEVLGIPNSPLEIKELFSRLPFRIKTQGMAGLIWWCWDIGYKLEYDERARRRQNELPPASQPSAQTV